MPVKDFWTSRGSKVNLNNRHISSKWSFSKHPKTGLKLRELSASNSIWHIWPSSCIVKHRNLYRLHGSKRSIFTMSNRLNHLELTLLTLPGTARYCQVLPECGGAVAPRSRPNCRCPWESQASERWLPGSRSTRIRTKQDYQDSCCLWSFMVLSCFVVLSLASEAQRTKNVSAHLRSSMHIFHHLPSSSIIFHHLPSSSKSTWISHD